MPDDRRKSQLDRRREFLGERRYRHPRRERREVEQTHFESRERRLGEDRRRDEFAVMMEEGKNYKGKNKRKGNEFGASGRRHPQPRPPIEGDEGYSWETAKMHKETEAYNKTLPENSAQRAYREGVRLSTFRRAKDLVSSAAKAAKKHGSKKRGLLGVAAAVGTALGAAQKELEK